MPRILTTDRNSPTGKNETGGLYFINGKFYSNSAAKFWFGLADELNSDFPDCTNMELSTVAADSLTPDLLFPEIALGREIERLMFADIETEKQNTIAELEIIGPPPPVHVRLLNHETEIVSACLSPDIIDSEIFSSLVAWQLKWADIPDSQWNNETLPGSISIEDRKHGLVYHMSFILKKLHLSEGLFRRSININSSLQF